MPTRSSAAVELADGLALWLAVEDARALALLLLALLKLALTVLGNRLAVGEVAASLDTVLNWVQELEDAAGWASGVDGSPWEKVEVELPSVYIPMG